MGEQGTFTRTAYLYLTHSLPGQKKANLYMSHMSHLGKALPKRAT